MITFNRSLFPLILEGFHQGNLWVALPGIILILGVIAFYIWSLVWLYRDGEKRGGIGCLMVILVGFAWPLGLIVWLLARPAILRKVNVPAGASVSCHRCGYTIPAGTEVCPNCAEPREEVWRAEPGAN